MCKPSATGLCLPPFLEWVSVCLQWEAWILGLDNDRISRGSVTLLGGALPALFGSTYPHRGKVHCKVALSDHLFLSCWVCSSRITVSPSTRWVVWKWWESTAVTFTVTRSQPKRSQQHIKWGNMVWKSPRDLRPVLGTQHLILFCPSQRYHIFVSNKMT